MDQISTFLHLGGYGAYVWPAYGVAAFVLIGLLWRSVASLRANERLVTSLQTVSAPRGTMKTATQASAAPHGAAH